MHASSTVSRRPSPSVTLPSDEATSAPELRELHQSLKAQPRLTKAMDEHQEAFSGIVTNEQPPFEAVSWWFVGHVAPL